MKARAILGPILLAYAGAYLFAVEWLGLVGLQASVMFGEAFILLTILMWDARKSEEE